MQQVWIYIQLNTDQHYQALHSALRAPFAQQCFRSTTQHSAFAPSCSIRIGLHSQSDEAQHLPCTALQPWRASFVQQCFRLPKASASIRIQPRHMQHACFCRRLTLASRITFTALYACMTKTAEATRTA